MDPAAIQHDRDKIRYTKRITKLKAANDELLLGMMKSPGEESSGGGCSIKEESLSPMGEASSVESSDVAHAAIAKLVGELVAIEHKVSTVRQSDLRPHLSAYSSMSEPRLFDDEAWLNKHANPVHYCSTLRPCAPENRYFWILRDLTIMIEWMKCQPVVQRMLLSDKMALVKTFAPVYPLLQLAFYSTYSHADCLVYPDGTYLEREDDVEHSADSQLSSRPIISMLIDGVHQRMRQMNLGLSEFLLYKLMLLVNPDADGLSQNGKRDISNERQVLLAYLHQHIAAIHADRSTEVFATLLMMTATLNRIASFQKRDFELAHIFQSSEHDDLVKQLIMGGM